MVQKCQILKLCNIVKKVDYKKLDSRTTSNLKNGQSESAAEFWQKLSFNKPTFKDLAIIGKNQIWQKLVSLITFVLSVDLVTYISIREKAVHLLNKPLL